MINGVLPQHVAIVMDGNGRWARVRHLPRIAGHRAGEKAVRRTVEYAIRQKIRCLTLFALSVENLLHRPAKEIHFLMDLFLESLNKNTTELHENNVQIQVIGDRSVLSQALQRQIVASETLTANNQGLVLVIALNYSGRWDIVQASKRIAKMAASGAIKSEVIDEAFFQQHLCLSHLPLPDLFIRTSGERRMSNFMLWQCAYSELFFTDLAWPDFNEEAFDQALQWYCTRQRRFGGVVEHLEQQHA